MTRPKAPEAASEPGGKRRVAVLVSGRGSNLQALIEAAAAPDYPAAIALVIADRADAAGLARAGTAGIPAEVLDPAIFANREVFERTLSDRLQAAEIALVCLAGFMRILSPWFVARWRDRVLNIHPALLPAFPGLGTHRRALEAGVRVHGCTVHLVRAQVDAGPILVQGVVPVRADDTPPTLAGRVLAVEHRCYPRALALLASGRARIDGERVVVRAGEPVLDTAALRGIGL